MPGLRVWDASADLILDTSSSALGRVLGTVAYGSTNGSVTNSGFSNGTPFWFFVPQESSGAQYQPSASISGTTLSWTWDVQITPEVTYGIIVYGFY